MKKWFNTRKLINMMYHISKLKNKISEGTEKAFGKLYFHDRNLQQMDIEGTYFNTNKNYITNPPQA